MEAMAIAQQEGNAVLVARVHYNFGDIDRVMGDAASALVQFDHALAIEEKFRSPNFLSSLLMARSEVLLALERWDDALAASMRAFQHAEQHRPSSDTTTAATNLAALYSRRGEADLAAAWQVRADAETADFRRESSLVREKLIELWSQQSRWAAAA
jgi:tetratricopeptide (TPR) repeat protein